MEVKSLNDVEQRLNYENFGEVCRSRYVKGTISSVHLASQDPITLRGTCDVGDFSEVPIFYHCGQSSTIEGAGGLAGEKALKGGAMGFRPGVEAKILLDGNEPVVIGHADNKPRRCQDLIKLALVRAPSSGSFETLLMASAQGKYDGSSYPLEKKAIRLMGEKEFWYMTMMYLPFIHAYWGDWLIELGPLMFILQTKSYVGFPAGVYNTIDIQMLAAPYDEKLKEDTIALGQQYEDEYIKDQIYVLKEEMPSDPYPGFVKQTQFTQSLKSLFGGTTAPQPRWFYTEIFTEDVDWGIPDAA